MQMIFEVGVAHVRFLNGIVLKVVIGSHKIHSLVLSYNEKRFKSLMQSVLPPQFGVFFRETSR